MQVLRFDKQQFMEALRNGYLELTSGRLNIASHIENNPECECAVCGTDFEVNEKLDRPDKYLSAKINWALVHAQYCCKISIP